MEIPMLDEAEYARVSEAYLCAFRSYQGQRPVLAAKFGPMDAPDIQARFRPMLEMYTELTGFDETNPNAILHHRIALYGSPCIACGKPLRSPRARFCAACGARVESAAPAI